MTIADFVRNKIHGMKKYEDNLDRKYNEQDDTVTKDRYLRSLRRQKRIEIDEKYEKIKLKKQIDDEFKKRTRENVWGVKSTSSKSFNAPNKPKFKLCDKKNSMCSLPSKPKNLKGNWIKSDR